MKTLKKFFSAAFALVIVGMASISTATAVEQTNENAHVKVYTISPNCFTEFNCSEGLGNIEDIIASLDCTDFDCTYFNCSDIIDSFCKDSDCFEDVTPPSKPEENNPSTPPRDSDETDTPQKPDESDSDSSNENITVSQYEKEVAELVNEIRISNGLNALKLNNELSNVARIKSQDMKDNAYFSHTSPTYGSPFEMMSSFGISYKTAGENIAKGYATPEAVVNGWMNSEGHRKNILNSSFTEIGIGYVADGNYWTQMFIG